MKKTSTSFLDLRPESFEILTDPCYKNPVFTTEYYLLVVLDGEGHCCHRDNFIKMSKSDLYCVFPFVKHYIFPLDGESWTVLRILLKGEDCSQFFSLSDISFDNPFLFGAFQNTLLEDLINSLSKDTLLLGISNCYKMLHTIFGLRHNEHEDDEYGAVPKAIHYIEQNYHNHIEVDMICNLVNYSRSYFSRCFKKETGISIPEYINNVRIKRAIYLLENTKLYINEISKSVGFSDPFYFSRIFKRITGKSPSEYLENEVI